MALPAGFLSEERSSDDARWLPPPRRDCRIEPLVDACAAYDSMEKALLNAGESIWLAHWSLDTDFATQSATVRDAGVHDWTSLLTDAVVRGAEVRILLNDFDPNVEYGWHLEAWQSYRHLMRKADEAAAADTEFDRRRFQVIVALHEARLDFPALSVAARWNLGEAVKALNDWARDNGIASAQQAFEFLPRLWRHVAFDRDATPPFRINRSVPVDPVHIASHHQKLCIIDGRTAFLGGIDIGEKLISNGRHEANPYRHDVHFRVTGPVVADLVRIFRAHWNREGRAARDFVRGANAIATVAHLPVSHYDQIARKDPPLFRTGTSIAQLIRTETGRVVTPPAPEALRLDTEDCVKRAIKAAEKFVYIESQYLRWPVIVDWLSDARTRSPELRVIVVVPLSPEEAGGLTDIDPVTSHGMHLQHVTLKRLNETFGGKSGIFTLTSRVGYAAQPRLLERCAHMVDADEHATPELFRAPSIYVHSKILIVDDRFALIGSANFDGRAFRVDNEIGLAWFHSEEIVRFRLRLWQEHLGPDLDLVHLDWRRFVQVWEQRAVRNQLFSPAHRPGFVVRYPLETAPKGSESAFDPRLMNIMARGIGDDTAGYRSAGLAGIRRRPRALVS